MTDIASGNQAFVNSLIGNTNRMNAAKLMTFYRTYSGPGLLISKANNGSYLAIASDSSSSIPKSDIKFPSSKSNCTDLNKWHVISVTWSNKGENLSNCWSDGEKLTTFITRNVKGFDYCYIEDLEKMLDWKKYVGIMPSLNKRHLAGCISPGLDLIFTAPPPPPLVGKISLYQIQTISHLQSENSCWICQVLEASKI